MIPVCPLRSEMMVSGRFFMGVSYAGCVFLEPGPFSAVVCKGQGELFCFRHFAGLFGMVFIGEKSGCPDFSSWQFGLSFFYVSAWKYYMFFCRVFTLDLWLFFLTDWFDNGLVCNLGESSVLPDPVMWSLFDVNGTGKWNGRRV